MKSGVRISLQMKVERQPDIHYPETFREVYYSGIKTNKSNELFQFLKCNIEHMLDKIVFPADRKIISAIPEGSSTSWCDCINPGTNVYDDDIIRNLFYETLQSHAL